VGAALRKCGPEFHRTLRFGRWKALAAENGFPARERVAGFLFGDTDRPDQEGKPAASNTVASAREKSAEEAVVAAKKASAKAQVTFPTQIKQRSGEMERDPTVCSSAEDGRRVTGGAFKNERSLSPRFAGSAA